MKSMFNFHHGPTEEGPGGADLSSSSSNSTSTWKWDEADEIAFVLQEEQEGQPRMHRSAYLKKMILPAHRSRQRHMPHAIYYPFALTAW